MRRFSVLWSLIALAIVVAAGPSRAEGFFSLYLGGSSTHSSDLHVIQPSTGSDATFHGVRWDGKELEPPLYYGMRAGLFLPRNPRIGLELDFTHYKVYARTGDSLDVDGTWNGQPVSENAPLGDRVQSFSISHGVNTIGLHLLYRWTVSPSARYPMGRLQPYVGIGPAYYIVHPENDINNQHNDEKFEDSGFGWEALAGVRYGLTPRWNAVAIAKYSSGRAKVGTAGGGEAKTDLDTWHAILGIEYGF